jgi:homocysteine S-methyltransferase
VTAFSQALDERVVVLDGGLATELERRGRDLSGALWSARVLADDPDEIVAVHRAYFAAGAQVATTASYQASFEGFAELGLDAAVLLRRGVALARRAADEAPAQGVGRRWVAASVGPYGAVLADGSEYRGDYGVTVGDLRRFHRGRLEVLATAGADVLAVETIPNLTETEALIIELAELGVPAWLSLTCEGTRTRAGEPVAEAFAMARDCPAVVAVGVNCSAPAGVTDVVELAARASGKPVVVYPNSGETWNPQRRRWEGDSLFDAADVARWIAAGARAVGGCCRVGPPEIRALADMIGGGAAGVNRARPSADG